MEAMKPVFYAPLPDRYWCDHDPVFQKEKYHTIGEILVGLGLRYLWTGTDVRFDFTIHRCSIFAKAFEVLGKQSTC